MFGNDELVLENRRCGARPKLKLKQNKNKNKLYSNLLLDSGQFWHDKPVPVKPDSRLRISPSKSVGDKATLDLLDYGPRLSLRNTMIENTPINEKNTPGIESDRKVNLPIETEVELESTVSVVASDNLKVFDVQRHLQESFKNFHDKADQSDQLSTEKISVTETR